MELLEYSRETIAENSSLLKYDSPQISSYEEWVSIIHKELGLSMTVEEVIEYFAMEREIEDNYLTLKHCGR